MARDNQLQTTLNNILEDKNTNLLPENLKKGVTALGIEGELEEGVDTSDATATTTDIVKNKTAYSASGFITGSIVEVASGSAGAYARDEGLSVTDKPAFNILEGRLPFRTDVLHRANSTAVFNISYSILATAIGLTADKIKAGEVILGITGTYAEQ